MSLSPKINPALLFVIIITLSRVSMGQATYFPEKDKWEHKNPAALGINPEKLNQAVEYALANEYSGDSDLRIAIYKSFGYEPGMEIVGPARKRGGPAGIILKDGYIVSEWGDIERVDMTFSVTKSYLSTVVGLAVDDGLITSVKDKVCEYVWDGTFDGEHNMKISWEHLLNQSSDWSGQLFGMYDWADRPSRREELDDWKYRELHEPGSYYKYNDVRVNLLAYSALQVWRKPLPQVLKQRIMDPIGASSTWRWYGYSGSWVELDGLRMQSVSGGGHSGGGLFINTLDHARFGLLFMNNGKWKDRQLISDEWIRMATEPSPANPSYGFLWWLNGGNRPMEDVPESVFYASGFGGNYIIIDRVNNIVAVTRWLEPSRLSVFLKMLYDSLN
ncbi:MAG: serine hydrolase [Bacteroidales bacterium]|jgi:CubicO group peptidase (beta-lactamase class C family)|nr:serine hydrolase [Bacteroidales bacterium]